MGLSVVLLAYKEEENLRVILPDIISNVKATGEEYEIIVVDTEQPLDNTKQVCQKYNVIYVNQKYPHFGGAFRTGIETAVYEKFLIMDSDGSHPARYIPDIYKEFKKGADIVIGSRYTKGGKTNDAVISVIMSKILNFVYRIVIGIKTKDISTDFRIYDTAQLKKTELRCENYDVLQEVIMQMKLNKHDLVIKEVPIEFNKRIYGTSKRKLLLFILGYIKMLFKLLNMRISNALKKHHSKLD